MIRPAVALLSCVATLMAAPAVHAADGWSVARDPGMNAGVAGYSATIRDGTGGGVLFLECSRGVRSAYVTAHDDLNVFVHRGEKATVYLQVGTAATTTHDGTFMAKRDGLAVFQVEDPAFVDGLADGEVRVMVVSNNARYLVTLEASATGQALAPIRSCAP